MDDRNVGTPISRNRHSVKTPRWQQKLISEKIFDRNCGFEGVSRTFWSIPPISMLGSDTLVVLLWDRHHAPVTRVDTNHCQESRQYTNTVQLSFRQVFLVAGEMVWIQNLNPGGRTKIGLMIYVYQHLTSPTPNSQLHFDLGVWLFNTKNMTNLVGLVVLLHNSNYGDKITHVYVDDQSPITEGYIPILSPEWWSDCGEFQIPASIRKFQRTFSSTSYQPDISHIQIKDD